MSSSFCSLIFIRVFDTCYTLYMQWMVDEKELRVIHYTLGPLKPWDWWTSWLLKPVDVWQVLSLESLNKVKMLLVGLFICNFMFSFPSLPHPHPAQRSFWWWNSFFFLLEIDVSIK